MKATVEQRLGIVEESLAEMKHALLGASFVKKDWRAAAGKLRDSAFAREVDRLGKEYRQQQNQQEG